MRSFSAMRRLSSPIRCAGRRGRVAGHCKEDLVLDEAKARAHGKWAIVAASSFEPGEGAPIHAVDGDPDSFWHSRYGGEPAQAPHHLSIDFGKPLNVAAVIYIARKDMDHSHVRDYEITLVTAPRNGVARRPKAGSAAMRRKRPFACPSPSRRAT